MTLKDNNDANMRQSTSIANANPSNRQCGLQSLYRAIPDTFDHAIGYPQTLLATSRRLESSAGS